MIIEIYVMGLNKSYEIQVSEEITAGELAQYISGITDDTQRGMLLSVKRKGMLRDDTGLGAMGVSSGELLLYVSPDMETEVAQGRCPV